MSRKLAVKKLKASDLSFFRSYYTAHDQTKQKAFNLDKDIFQRLFFPSLQDEVDAAPGQRAPIALTFFGPGGAAPHLLMRKVLLQQKNWRLNGELVSGTDDDPARYDDLKPNDLAILEFTGAAMPTAIKVVLLQASDVRDASTHAAFLAAFGGDSMAVLAEDTLEQLIASAAPPADHPIRDWLDSELLEDVALGGSEATSAVLKKRKARGVSPAELAKALANAAKVGRLGEEHLDYHFTATGTQYTWVAAVNAIAPYDFEVRDGGGTRHVDAKSTAGPFDNPIHLSMSEIIHAAAGQAPYDLFRLYRVDEAGARLRVATSIAGNLQGVLASINTLPAGVKVDSFSFQPDFFSFGKEQLIQVTDADDADALS